MNRKAAAAVLAASCALFSSCASLPPPDAPKTRVSADYEASGDLRGVRAFVYGKRTVLDIGDAPAWVSVRDENGVAVEYEREGHYMRMSRKLDSFSLWLGMRAISFKAVQAPAVAVAEASPAMAAVPPAAAQPLEPVRLTATKLPTPAVLPPADDPNELLRVSAAQLAELRQAMAGATPPEARELTARLNRIDAQITRAATAIVRVQFETARADFDPSGGVARTLVPAAKAAERINVRGRTDARVADTANARIALARALAARQYLVDHGVDAAKIKVFSLPAGDFVAPDGSAQGRALNRRVDIELVNRRYAEAKPVERTVVGSSR